MSKTPINYAFLTTCQAHGRNSLSSLSGLDNNNEGILFLHYNFHLLYLLYYCTSLNRDFNTSFIPCFLTCPLYNNLIPFMLLLGDRMISSKAWQLVNSFCFYISHAKLNSTSLYISFLPGPGPIRFNLYSFQLLRIPCYISPLRDWILTSSLMV